MKFLTKHWLILIAIITIAIYFKPEFENKVLIGADSSQEIAKNRARTTYTEKNGENYLWNPGIFSGMDILHGATSKANIYQYFMKLKHSLPSRGFGIFVLCLLLSYFLGNKIGFSRILSTILAFSITFSLSNIVLYKVGHFSKIDTLIYTPLILAGIYLIFEKSKYILGLFTLILGIGLSIYTRHPQMNYYLFLTLLPYIIMKSAVSIQQRDTKHLIKAFGFGFLAITLGLGSNIDRIWNLKVHSDASMRGKKILTNSSLDNSNNDVKNGLDWSYAMAWSNNNTDVISTIIPGYSGGSSSEKLDPNHNLAKKYGIKAAPLYWGGLPFTESPMYLGVILFFLMILSLTISRGVWIWGLFSGITLSILISYGKNVEGLQRILFDYFPLYNKFRAPSSILNITSYLIPVVALWILHKVRKLNNINFTQKKLWITSVVFIAFLIFCMSILPELNELTKDSDQRYTSQGLQLYDLLDARRNYINSDSLRAIFLVLLATLIIHLYLLKKIKYNLMLLGILGLISFDMFTVNARYYSFDEFERKSSAFRAPSPRQVDTQILSLEKNREDYRLLDLSINTFNNTISSYYHNTIGGYSPVKYQRYQDIIDNHIVKGNMNVLNMLNTKYIINQQGRLQKNQQANGNAWFVNSIKLVGSPSDEISQLDSVNTRTTAIINKNEFEKTLTKFDTSNDKNGVIEKINYSPDEITYRTLTSAPKLAVFSEIWMDGNQWKLYVDGNEKDLLRANYILRAGIIPAGEHTVTLKFEPKSYIAGRKYTLVFGFLVLAFASYLIYKHFIRRKVQNQS